MLNSGAAALRKSKKTKRPVSSCLIPRTEESLTAWASLKHRVPGLTYMRLLLWKPLEWSCIGKLSRAGRGVCCCTEKAWLGVIGEIELNVLACVLGNEVLSIVIGWMILIRLPGVEVTGSSSCREATVEELLTTDKVLNGVVAGVVS